MKRIMLAAAFTLAGTFGALADVGSGLVGNTVTLTGPNGDVTKIFYPDASSTVVKRPDGSEVNGSWRVDGDKICTVTGDAPETCTQPITEAPAAGMSGVIKGEQGDVAWTVTAGKDF